MVTRMVISAITLLLFASLALGQAINVVKPETVGLSSERLARLDKMLTQYAGEKKIPGAVALIYRHGKVVYFKSFGMADIEAGVPMRNDSMFRIASMSKALTSTAVMMLYEEGRFLLNDPVSKFIPEFRDMKVMVADSSGGSPKLVPAKREITIRHLLNHTSGLTYGSGPVAPFYKNAGMTVGLTPTEGTIGEMIRKLAGLPLVSQPGEEFQYGMSIDVLGYLVERVSGMTFDKFMEERIFKPLGMKDTCFTLPQAKLPRVARLYRLNREGVLVKDPVDPVYLCSQTYFSGGAGLVSTAADYLKFAQMILNNGQLNGVRLLSRKTVELMTTNSIGDLYAPFRDTSGDKFGYGFGIRTERGVHDELESLGIIGWDGAFHTRCWIDPKEDLIGIYMSQADGTLKTYTRYRVLVYQAIAD
ncbi:MAG: serine hydrolase domain-containing protein [Candidatus Latescibacterota bacterium]